MRNCKTPECVPKKPKLRIKYRKNVPPRYWCGYCGRKL